MVRVVHQDVAVAQPVEDAARHLAVGQLRVGRRDERAVLQIVAVALAVDLPQRRQVQQAGHPQHVVAVHVELADQQVEHVVADRRGHLEPHRRAEPALGQLALQGLQQVLVAVLVDLELGVAGHPEQVPLEDLHAGEELVEVGGDELLDRQEARAAAVVLHGHEARHVVRHLDPGEQLGLPPSGSRSATARFERPARRCTGTGAPGRPPAGSAPGRPARGSRSAAARAPAASRSSQRTSWMLSAASFGRTSSAKQAACRVTRSAVRSVIISSWWRSGRPVAAAHRQAGLQPALEAGDPDHVELVEVAGEDGQELRPLQQRRPGVLGERQHPGVEVQPGQLPVEETVVRQVGVVLVGVRRRIAAVNGHGRLRRSGSSVGCDRRAPGPAGGRLGDPGRIATWPAPARRAGHAGRPARARTGRAPTTAARRCRNGSARRGSMGRGVHRTIIARPR